MINIVKRDGLVTYDPYFLNKVTNEYYFNRLMNEIDWGHLLITIYGKTHPIPRLTKWYGKPYNYSGISNLQNELTPLINEIKSLIDEAVGQVFNSVLLNLYESGGHSISWHSDDEPELGDTIASLSLGGVRKFSLKHKISKDAVSIELLPGSLLVMSGDTQKNWLHCVPKTTKQVTPRINLTFRQIKI